MESTVWHNVKPTFVGAYWDRGIFFCTTLTLLNPLPIGGFSSPLVLHIANALMEAFPFIRPHHLEYFWAYAYDNAARNDRQANPAIDVHADEAQVNFNMWLTPSEANDDPSSGGLTVWKKKPPASWEFKEYNSPKSVEKVKAMLSDVTPTVVEYRYNRAIVFDSDFFHQSQPSLFKAGHSNRRINLTLLFGAHVYTGTAKEVAG